MANCRTCGEKAGTLKNECDACKNIRLTEERRIAAEQQAARSEAEREAARIAEEQRQERYALYMHDRFAEIHELVKAGRTPYLYKQAYSAIDSYVDGTQVSNDPDFSDIDFMGWSGWELVGTVPHTAGRALVNTHQEGFAKNETWGGGIGGLVIGCYFMLRLPVDEYVLEHQRELVSECFAEQFPG